MDANDFATLSPLPSATSLGRFGAVGMIESSHPSAESWDVEAIAPASVGPGETFVEVDALFGLLLRSEFSFASRARILRFVDLFEHAVVSVIVTSRRVSVELWEERTDAPATPCPFIKLIVVGFTASPRRG